MVLVRPPTTEVGDIDDLVSGTNSFWLQNHCADRRSIGQVDRVDLQLAGLLWEQDIEEQFVGHLVQLAGDGCPIAVDGEQSGELVADREEPVVGCRGGRADETCQACCTDEPFIASVVVGVGQRSVAAGPVRVVGAPPHVCLGGGHRPADIAR